MYYVLKHKETGEIFSCSQKNVYDFMYHGVKSWEDEDAAEAELGLVLAEHGYDEPSNWEVFLIPEEHTLKMCNVKLANNPAKRIFMLPDGRLEARSDT
ncbi:hypothetical protein [Paenibacillus sp. YN15]|uniref:hypothetical protein n=1 Tax=Paenibacillus sp. YN15 TaxID=1742774 RepID=UPI000DCE1AE3|nr:hypothetical protein [Paenibacillus sp. YN15]RAV04143.1 hypothetical protein DQG13_06610 [Paenibacillus sp. YN15]